jgi:hypothetical protein
MGGRAHRRRRGAEGSAPGFWAAHHNGELTAFVAALAAVLVTVVLGGFRDGTPPVVDRRAGQAVDLGAWQVTVSGAQLPAPRADRVTVSLQVTNLTRGTRPTGDLRNVSPAADGSVLAPRPVDDTVAAFDPGVPVAIAVDLPMASTSTVTLLLRRDPPPADPHPTRTRASAATTQGHRSPR